MRLWHYKLIPLLPRQQLLGQHRECCALRGNGWGKKHSVVDYVFTHSPLLLVQYHMEVINELERRGYIVESSWKEPSYRGKNCECYTNLPSLKTAYHYPEHDEAYLEECLANLAAKGVFIDKSNNPIGANKKGTVAVR
ncbi:MAG: hypothetical protein H6Q75_935 [Firmicutes bacterium]|nr:hypothetical protein [Bacillota bacterium]